MDDAGLSSLIGLICDAAHDQVIRRWMPVMLNALAAALRVHQGVSVFYNAERTAHVFDRVYSEAIKGRCSVKEQSAT